VSEGLAALVTGGGSGIGEAIARRLAGDGMRVCVNGRREQPLRRVAGEIGGCWAAGDTGIPDQAAAVVGSAVEQLGRLDALVVNAGISHSGSVLTQTPEGWDGVIRTNLTAGFLICHAALPHLERSGGSVVAVSSLAALRAAPESAAYCVSKAGLVMLMRSIAVDFGPRGVRANAVCPGWIRTDMADGAMDEVAQMRGTDREGAYRRVHKTMPIRRPGETDEVSSLVAWLLSPAASYVNGAAIPIDGGMSVLDLGLIEFAEEAP
jgi:meso-butanediol dehydrogenase/(S,S)-butanediol dehydrogenase/diacetyl reductase